MVQDPLKGINNLFHLMLAFTTGFQGKLSVLQLDERYNGKWRSSPSYRVFFSRRKKIMSAIEELKEKKAYDSLEDAAKEAERRRVTLGSKSADWVGKHIYDVFPDLKSS